MIGLQQTHLRCPECQSHTIVTDLNGKDSHCTECKVVFDLKLRINPITAKQLTISSLNSSFNLPTSNRKTLKTSVKKSEGLECAVLKAYDFIQRGNSEGYTCIEFPYGNCYFVIAKLKDKS